MDSVEHKPVFANVGWKQYLGCPSNMKHKYPANSYIRNTAKAKVRKSKQPQSYSFYRILDDLEPYSLYPRDELIWLLKLFCFLIFYHAKAGKLVKIPFLGSFFTAKDMYDKPYPSKYSDFGIIDGNTKLQFAPSNFVQWGLNPEQYTPYIYQHIPEFFRTLEAFRKESLYSNIDWNLMFPDAKFLLFALEKLKCNGTLGDYAGISRKRYIKPTFIKQHAKKVPGRTYGLEN